jgi:hypothetical protein
MKKHTIETNHGFLKSLKANAILGTSKLKFYDAMLPDEIEFLYKVLAFRMHANEFKTGYSSKIIRLTEYIKNESQTPLKLKA